MLSSLEDQVESKVQIAIEGVLKNQMEVATRDTKSHLQKHFRHLMEGYVNGALADVQTTEITAAETTAIKSTTTLMRATEARLQTILKAKLAEIAHDAAFGSSGKANEASNVVDVMREHVGAAVVATLERNFGHLEQQMQITIKNVLENHLTNALLMAETTADECAQRRATSTEIKIRQLEDRVSSLVIATPDAKAVTDINAVQKQPAAMLVDGDSTAVVQAASAPTDSVPADVPASSPPKYDGHQAKAYGQTAVNAAGFGGGR